MSSPHQSWQKMHRAGYGSRWVSVMLWKEGPEDPTWLAVLLPASRRLWVPERDPSASPGGAGCGMTRWWGDGCVVCRVISITAICGLSHNAANDSLPLLHVRKEIILSERAVLVLYCTWSWLTHFSDLLSESGEDGLPIPKVRLWSKTCWILREKIEVFMYFLFLGHVIHSIDFSIYNKTYVSIGLLILSHLSDTEFLFMKCAWIKTLFWQVWFVQLP